MSPTSKHGAGKRRGFLALFANLAFMLLWTGQLISYLGDRLDQMTLLKLVEAKSTQPDAVMTNIGFFILLPFVLFAPLAGAAADRYSRRAILVVTSFFQGLIILAVPFVGPTAIVQNNLVAMIYLVTFLIGSFTIFFYTAKTALIPQLVGESELMAANSLCSFAGTMMTLVGTFAAYGLFWFIARGYFDLRIMFFIDSATYFISGAMFALIVIPAGARLERRAISEPFFRKIAIGFRYVLGHGRVLKVLALSITVYFLAGAAFATVNGATLGVLGWATEDYALAVGVLGIGMITGAITATLAQRRIHSLEFVAAGCFAIAALCLLPLFGMRRIAQLNLPQPVVLWAILAPPLLVIGGCGGALIVLVITHLQRWVPRRLHGRVLALNSMCDVAVQLIAMGGGALLLRHNHYLWVAAITLLFALGAAAGTLVSGEFSRHWLVRSLVRLFVRVYCRMESEGHEHVPRRGSLIVASNHVGWLDTLFLGAAVPRLIHFIAAREYYDRWYLKWIMWLFGTIPVERGKGHRQPFNRMLAALHQGRVLGVFPEGRMSLDGHFHPLEGGIALVSLETGAPVLPVAILGGDKAMGPYHKIPRPRKVRVRIGKLIHPDGLTREEILQRVETAIRDLLGSEA